MAEDPAWCNKDSRAAAKTRCSQIDKSLYFLNREEQTNLLTEQFQIIYIDTPPWWRWYLPLHPVSVGCMRDFPLESEARKRGERRVTSQRGNLTSTASPR